ncbi:HAMP domain-containing sensor histidine kinase [uncultured Winogradskyella sp.]|uniref:sensor histidine kinase n=1 Tax=uncultured Winogradskyella sp. TaxID=395353 RepID=UPI00262B42A3|nr:HAMP domain-containing sensor histidine kinase [uncultured Winogradskyella sp.]
MNNQRYRWILYVITAVIAATITIQVYWNYKNYQTNKQQLIRDVQISLDKAVDDYYASLAKATSIGFSDDNTISQQVFTNDTSITSIIKSFDSNFDYLDSVEFKDVDRLHVIKGIKSNPTEINFSDDSLQLKDIEFLTTKIFFSIRNDSLDLRKVNLLLNKDLKRKELDLNYHLNYYHDILDKCFLDKNEVTSPKLSNTEQEEHNIYVESNSAFLPKNSSLKLRFSNDTKVILKRSLGGILISMLLVLVVISCLFYLLKIIKNQKQFAEVKNDLISNITHEFKTPIATIGVALESINNFNGINDKEKTQKYIGMSSEQLSKLNTMVEKLLETATLDSDSLELNKEPVNILELLTTLSNRYEIHFPNKDFNNSFKIEHLTANVDLFHFENALNNILDNAVKYGGKIISIDLIPRNKNFEIHISDNGNNLSKVNKDKIFEKFYRVPKGNTHDVKGFGIGLYYTKTIIEKHGGHIDIDLSNQLTTFKITLPNG